MTVAQGVNQLNEFHILIHRGEILVYHGIERHKGQHTLIRMVGDEFALSSQSHAVYAVRLEGEW